MKTIIPVRTQTPFGSVFSFVTPRTWPIGSTIYPFGGEMWEPPPAVPPAVYLETAADGSGQRVSPTDAYRVYWDETPDGAVRLYAIQRDENGDFVQNVAATYLLDVTSGDVSVTAADIGTVAADGKSFLLGSAMPAFTRMFSGRLAASVDGFTYEWTGIVHWMPSIGEDPQIITDIGDIPWSTLRADYYYWMEGPEPGVDSFLMYGPGSSAYPGIIGVWAMDGGDYGRLNIYTDSLTGQGNKWNFVGPSGEIFDYWYSYSPYGTWVANTGNYVVISPYVS